MVEAAIVKVDKDQATFSQGREADEAEMAEGSVDPGTASTQLKHQHPVERPRLRKKVKASKLSIDPITLTEGDLHNIKETVHDVTSEDLQNFMQENQNLLGALRV